MPGVVPGARHRSTARTPAERMIGARVSSAMDARVPREALSLQPVHTTFETNEQFRKSTWIPDAMLRKERACPINAKNSINFCWCESGSQSARTNGVSDSADRFPLHTRSESNTGTTAKIVVSER